MFVKLMLADEWQDRTDQGFRVTNPVWNQVMQAIIALDGKRKTIVTIADRQDSDHYMIIAGQWDGRFLVNSTKDNIDFFSLSDAARSSGKVTLHVGGQYGVYENPNLVPLAWAIDVARHFFETGELKSTVNWVSDY